MKFSIEISKVIFHGDASKKRGFNQNHSHTHEFCGLNRRSYGKMRASSIYVAECSFRCFLKETTLHSKAGSREAAAFGFVAQVGAGGFAAQHRCGLFGCTGLVAFGFAGFSCRGAAVCKPNAAHVQESSTYCQQITISGGYVRECLYHPGKYELMLGHTNLNFISRFWKILSF